MITLMDLRAGNYIHPARDNNGQEPDLSRYLRILSVDLVAKQVTAKADHDATIVALTAGQIYPCDLHHLRQLIGGLSFGEHSILLREDGVMIVHENGSPIPLPHIRHIHQFQNLFRGLTGNEFPFNLK
jgi:hypothetical protein